MITIQLSDEERGIVEQILQSYLSDLSAEIGKTEKLAFREPLKRQKAFIIDLLGRLHKAAA
jgi:hypothetical protein